MEEQKLNKKQERSKAILLGLVDLYLTTGYPVGSNTLKENGFDHLSSATIRNYFGELERDGYLIQQHSSGGRIPSSMAYKVYAEHHLPSVTIDSKDEELLKKSLNMESREVTKFLQKATDLISQMSGCAAFVTLPLRRFILSSFTFLFVKGSLVVRVFKLPLTIYGASHYLQLFKAGFFNINLGRDGSFFNFFLNQFFDFL